MRVCFGSQITLSIFSPLGVWRARDTPTYIIPSHSHTRHSVCFVKLRNQSGKFVLQWRSQSALKYFPSTLHSRVVSVLQWSGVEPLLSEYNHSQMKETPTTTVLTICWIQQREESLYTSHKIICFEIIFASPCLLLALRCRLIDSFFARALLLDLCL